MSTVKARLKQNMRFKIPYLIVNFVISGTKKQWVWESLQLCLWKLTYLVECSNDYSLNLVLEEVGVTISSIFKLMQVLRLHKFFWSFFLQKSIWIPDVCQYPVISSLWQVFLNVINAFFVYYNSFIEIQFVYHTVHPLKCILQWFLA